MKEFLIIISEEYYKMIKYLAQKWEKDTGEKYSLSDVMRVCLGSTYDMEKNSLNISLTNTSKS